MSRLLAVLAVVAMLLANPIFAAPTSAQDAVETPAPTEEPAVEPTAAEPASDPTVTDEPVDEPTVEVPVVDEPVVEEPTVEPTATATAEPTATATATVEPMATETVPAEAPADEDPTETEAVPTEGPVPPEAPSAEEPTVGDDDWWIAEPEPAWEDTAEPETSEISSRSGDQGDFFAAGIFNLNVSLTLTPGGSPAAGTSVTAQATWTGVVFIPPSGTVEYRVFTGAGCTGALYAEAGTKVVGGFGALGGAPSSDAVVMDVAGTFSWQAEYSGDFLYNPATVCVGQTIAKRTPTLSLSVAPSPATAGDGLTGTATLAGATAATGSVAYTVFTNSVCTTQLSTPGNPSVKPVTGGVPAPSDPIVVNTAGTVYWRAVYGGDVSFNGATSACVPVTIGKRTPTLSLTTASTSGAAGQPAAAKATLSGATSIAGGTVTYSAYTNSTCTTAIAGSGSTVTVTNGTVPTSAAVTIHTLTSYWRASYTPDDNHVGALSPCTVLTLAKASPTISLTVAAVSPPMKAGGAAVGTAVLSSSGGTAATVTAGGTVAYTVYGNSACTTVHVAADTQTVVNRTVPASSSRTVTLAGTVYWRAVYSGDANNNAATSPCVAQAVAKATPVVSVTVSPSETPMRAGGTARIRADFTAASTTATAGGTVTYTAYADAACATVFSTAGNPQTKTVTDRVAQQGDSLAFPSAITYSWRAAYSGDANNDAATSPCVAMPVAKSNPTATLAVGPVSPPMRAGGAAVGAVTLSAIGATAGGTVTYRVYTGGTCAVAAAIAGNPSVVTVANAVVPASAPLTMPAVGTYSWQATYGGDANNNAATSACVALTVGQATPSITLSITPANPIGPGQPFSGAATLTGATATAGGTASYGLYADAGCTALVPTAGNPQVVTVVNGVVPASGATSIPVPASYFGRVTYGGDAGNAAAASACVPITIGRTSPTLSLTVAAQTPPLRAGGAATGAATLTGATGAASGTVTYTVYAGSVCLTPLSPAASSTKPVVNGVVGVSSPVTLSSAGVVSWSATYSGDANNNPTTSACVAVTVAKATPAVSLTVSAGSIAVWGSASASASLSGATTTAGGTLVYTVYANDGCTVPVSPAKSSSRAVSNGAVPASASFAFDMAGAVYWRAAYGGDANNLPATSPCVAMTVIGGTLSVSVASVTMAPVQFSVTDQANTGTMVLTVVDQRGTADGWSVSLVVSDFAYSGVSPTGANIPAGNFVVTTARGPVRVSGQAIDATHGPAVPSSGATGPLDEPIVVVVADDGYGAGSYTQTYDVVLIIPGGSQSGTYTAVVDAVTSAAP